MFPQLSLAGDNVWGSFNIRGPRLAVPIIKVAVFGSIILGSNPTMSGNYHISLERDSAFEVHHEDSDFLSLS